MREHPLSLNRYLAEIGDAGRPLVASKLANLSALSPQELSVVVDAWAGIEVERRREIIGNLVQLAEDNPNLDFDDVFAACLDDDDETVKIRAIDGLWECENRGLIDVFITLLMKDAREPVRAAAATALGKFAMLAELGKSRDDDSAKVENALFAIIDDPGEQSEVTRRALEAIAPLSLPEVKAVIEQAYNSDDAKLRRQRHAVSWVRRMRYPISADWFKTSTARCACRLSPRWGKSGAARRSRSCENAWATPTSTFATRRSRRWRS